MLGYSQKYGCSFADDRVSSLYISLAFAWLSFLWFLSCYHMATSRAYKVSILYFVSLRVCSSPYQTRYFARIILSLSQKSQQLPPSHRSAAGGAFRNVIDQV